MSKPNRNARRLVRRLKADPACERPGYSTDMADDMAEMAPLSCLGPEGLARYLAAVEATS